MLLFYPVLVIYQLLMFKLFGILISSVFFSSFHLTERGPGFVLQDFVMANVTLRYISNMFCFLILLQCMYNAFVIVMPLT